MSLAPTCYACNKILTGKWSMEGNTNNNNLKTSSTSRYLGVGGYFFNTEENLVNCYCKQCWLSTIKKQLSLELIYTDVKVTPKCFTCKIPLDGSWTMETSTTNTNLKNDPSLRHIGVNNGYFFSNNSGSVYSFCNNCWISNIKTQLNLVSGDSFLQNKIQVLEAKIDKLNAENELLISLQKENTSLKNENKSLTDKFHPHQMSSTVHHQIHTIHSNTPTYKELREEKLEFNKDRQSTGKAYSIFVGNLGFKTSPQFIKSFFQRVGNVIDVRIAKNWEGLSKGFCYVDFDSLEAAEKAVGLAGESLDGREIRVDREYNNEGRTNSNSMIGSRLNNQKGLDNFSSSRPFSGEVYTCFVGNINYKTSPQYIKKFFSKVGNVLDVRIARKEEGLSKGFCHVDFDTLEAAEAATTLGGQLLDGREIRVDLAGPSTTFGRGGRGGYN